MNHLAAYLKKDGWIWAALIFCVVLCMMLGMQSESVSTEESRISRVRSEEHTSELQSHSDLVCRLLLEKKKYCHGL